MVGFMPSVLLSGKSVKDNLPAAQTWRRNLPPLHVIIKYQQKSQMKCVSHNVK